MPDAVDDANAVAHLEGAIAGARGLVADNPYAGLAASWAEGHDEARRRCGNGEDRAGHPGSVPHVCAGSPRAVCNCCTSCARVCTPGLRDIGRELVGVVLHRLGLRPRGGKP